VTFPSGELECPLFVEPQLQYLKEKDVFRIEELPDSIDDESKLVFSRRLVRESFLEIKSV
jgi:hypothetical protein